MMNRILKCLNTPTVSSWCHYSNLLSNFAPLVDDAILNKVNHRFRYNIHERCVLSKQGNRAASRLLCNNQQRRRSEVKKSHSSIKNGLDHNGTVSQHVARTSSCRISNELLFSSTGKEVEKYPEGKPSWEKLQHICVRLADTWPKFFVMKMDYTIFRDDVILEDRIYNRYIRGGHEYRTHFGALASAGRIMYPQIEMHVLSLTPIIEDATVRMRWRVYYMNILDFVLMLVQFQKFTPEYLKTKGRMVDGYSIYYADSNGAVYRHVIDKVIPDDEKGLAKGRLSLPQRLMALLGGSPAPKPAATTTHST